MTNHDLSLSAHLLLWVFPLVVATATVVQALWEARSRRGAR